MPSGDPFDSIPTREARVQPPDVQFNGPAPGLQGDLGYISLETPQPEPANAAWNCPFVDVDNDILFGVLGDWP